MALPDEHLPGDQSSRGKLIDALTDPRCLTWLLVAAVALWLRWVFACSAGGLWRDEANSAAIVGGSSLRDLWAGLDLDSFPILWLFCLRYVHVVGGDADFSYRLFGFASSVLSLIALVLIARDTPVRWPVFSTVLLGLSPCVIHWGGSSRAYGWGMLALLAMFWTYWRLIRSPDAKKCAWATLACVAAVQTLYTCAAFVAALAVSAAVVALRQKMTVRRVIMIFAPAAIAAFTYVPYIPVFQRQHAWSALVQHPVGMAWLIHKFASAIAVPSPYVLYIWSILFLAAIVAGLYRLLANRGERSAIDRDFTAFALLAPIIAVVLYFGFLFALRYPTQPWYYLGLMTVGALSIDSLLMPLFDRGMLRYVAPVFAIGYLWAFTLSVQTSVMVRQTNLDLGAASLAQATGPGDLIVLSTWEHGVTFNRYYRGDAPWTTVPPMSSHMAESYVPVKQAMMERDPMQSLFQSCATVLKHGGKVYVIDGVRDGYPRGHATVYPPAPGGPFGWDSQVYIFSWKCQLGLFLYSHAANVKYGRFQSNLPVNGYEDPEVQVFDGWRSDAAHREAGK